MSVSAAILLSAPAAQAQTANPNATLTITGAVSTPLTLGAGDLRTMPRKKLTVTNPHNKKTEAYEGLSPEELLHKAGVPHGEQLRGPAMVTYVIAVARDGYRVVFSLAELDSRILK